MNSLFLLVAAGCAGPGGESAATDTTCEGSTTDTATFPNLAGDWSASFAAEYYDDGICDIENLSRSSEGWITAMKILGSPSSSFALSYNKDRKSVV